MGATVIAHTGDTGVRGRVEMRYSRAGAHLGTRRSVTDAPASIFFLVYDPHKVPQVAVVFDALVGYPLAVLDRLGPGNQGHEVTLDDVFRTCWVDPNR